MRIEARGWLKLPLPTIVLALAVLAIGGVAVFVAFAGTRADELLATPAKPPTALAFDVTDVPRASDLASIQSQPLVYASRVFYVAPVQDAAPAAPPRPDYRLAGTVLVPRKPAVALLVSRQSGANRRVKPGDELDGWQIQSVDRKQVTLVWQNERFDITASAAPLAAGLKRVPMNRNRMASSSGGVQTLGTTGSVSSAVAGNMNLNPPRLYRPPPN